MISQEKLKQIDIANEILERGSRTRLTSIANKLAAERRAVKAKKKKSTFMNYSFIILASVIIFSIFKFTPFAKSITLNTMFKLQSEPDKIQKILDTKPMVILSGNFDTKEAALSYKKSMEKRLGVKLSLNQIGDKYSIQIGPSYKNHQDAILVFNELSKYSVQNLLLTFEN